MKIRDIITEGKTVRRSRLPDWMGGGSIKMEFNIDDIDGSLLGFSYVYANTKWCAVDNGRVLGIDSPHPSHKSYPHIHRCGTENVLNSDITLPEVKELFFNELQEFILSKVTKPILENNGITYDSILGVPELQAFIQQTDPLLNTLEQARQRAQHLYSGKPLTREDFNGNERLYALYQQYGDYAMARKKYDSSQSSKENPH